MALVKCRDCGGLLSTRAKQCPHCGAPKNMSDNIQGRNEIFAKDAKHGIIILIVLALLGIGFGGFESLDGVGVKGGNIVSPIFEREVVLNEVKIKTDEHIDRLGVITSDIFIGNPTKYKIKNIKVNCIDKSKTYVELKSNKVTLYEIVGAHDSISLKKVDIGISHPQRQFTMCKIIDFDFYD